MEAKIFLRTSNMMHVLLPSSRIRSCPYRSRSQCRKGRTCTVSSVPITNSIPHICPIPGPYHKPAGLSLSLSAPPVIVHLHSCKQCPTHVIPISAPPENILPIQAKPAIGIITLNIIASQPLTGLTSRSTAEDEFCLFYPRSPCKC